MRTVWQAVPVFDRAEPSRSVYLSLCPSVRLSGFTVGILCVSCNVELSVECGALIDRVSHYS